MWRRMPIPQAVLDLENRSLGARGEPTLGKAYALLCDAWRAGNRDREVALHLSFLAWYLVVEPPHLTGLAPTIQTGELAETLHHTHEFLLPHGAATDDAEALYVIGLAAHMFPWVFAGNDPSRIDSVANEWAKRAAEYRRRYRELLPNGMNPKTFEGRGAYGDYFAGQCRVDGGY